MLAGTNYVAVSDLDFAARVGTIKENFKGVLGRQIYKFSQFH